jgi:hypothetical protein
LPCSLLTPNIQLFNIPDARVLLWQTTGTFRLERQLHFCLSDAHKYPSRPSSTRLSRPSPPPSQDLPKRITSQITRITPITHPQLAPPPRNGTAHVGRADRARVLEPAILDPVSPPAVIAHIASSIASNLHPPTQSHAVPCLHTPPVFIACSLHQDAEEPRPDWVSLAPGRPTPEPSAASAIVLAHHALLR